MADAFGLGVLGYSTLAGGILTAKYRKGEKGRATDLKRVCRTQMPTMARCSTC